MAEAKRRLPLWMLKQKPETEAPGPPANHKSQGKSEDQIIEKPIKRNQRKRASEEKCDEAEMDVHRYQTRQTSTRTRKIDATEIGQENEQRKNRRKRKRMALISDDEEEHFTVDDLVTIAQQYVNADRDELNTTCTASAIDSSRPMAGPGLSKGLLKCSTSKFNNDSGKHALAENDNVKKDINNIPSNDGKTGDPAQDMLNLFLGPLLKIPPPPVREATIERVTSTSVESIVVEEREILVKKRSSFKDKVATFLS